LPKFTKKKKRITKARLTLASPYPSDLLWPGQRVSSRLLPESATQALLLLFPLVGKNVFFLDADWLTGVQLRCKNVYLQWKIV
jgi:hypothetical protein